MLVLLVCTLLAGIVGSETYAYNSRQAVNKGRNYCPVHKKIYDPLVEVHRNCQPVVRRVVVAPEYKYCSNCNTKYPAHLTHSCPPVRVVKKTPVVPTTRYTYSRPPVVQQRQLIPQRQQIMPVVSSGVPFANINITAVQRPVRYGIIRQYGGWGGYNRNYYNLSGRNYFRKWFGDRHHHRDHHEPRRHRHRDHHRGYNYGNFGGGYGGPSYSNNYGY